MRKPYQHAKKEDEGEGRPRLGIWFCRTTCSNESLAGENWKLIDKRLGR